MELKNKLTLLEHLVGEVITQKKVVASPQQKRRGVQRELSMG